MEAAKHIQYNTATVRQALPPKLKKVIMSRAPNIDYSEKIYVLLFAQTICDHFVPLISVLCIFVLL